MTTSRYNCLYYPDLLAPAGGVEVHAAKVAESVDALVLGASGVTRESSSLSFRTNPGSRATRYLSWRIVSITPVRMTGDYQI